MKTTVATWCSFCSVFVFYHFRCLIVMIMDPVLHYDHLIGKEGGGFYVTYTALLARPLRVIGRLRSVIEVLPDHLLYY